MNEPSAVAHVSVEWLSFSSLRESIQAFFSISSKPQQYQHDIDSIVPAHKIARFIGKRPPIAFVEKRVDVPAGLNTTYQTYLTVLGNGVEIAQRLQPSILTPFYRYCGELVNRSNDGEGPQQLSALSSFSPNNLDSVLEEIGQCFLSGQYTTKVPFKQAFRQVRQVEKDAKRASELIEAYQRTDRNTIFKTLENLDELLNVLYNDVKEPSSWMSLDEQQQFAQLCYTVGREVEFYGSLGFWLQQLSAAFNRCATTLEQKN